jgi:intracellular sulfur oxidation DsrE/DsrF family protein
VGRRGQHALAANCLHQLRAEDIEPAHLVDFVETVSASSLVVAAEVGETRQLHVVTAMGDGMVDWVA